MSFVADLVKDAFEIIWDAIDFIWDEIIMPALEEIFSWIGIVDEIVVIVGRANAPVYDLSDPPDLYRTAVVDAVIKNTKNPQSFFDNYLNEVFKLRGRLRAFKNYSNRQFGDPSMIIRSNAVEPSILEAALAAEFPGNPSVSSSFAALPNPIDYLKETLQNDVSYLYDYNDNTLRFPLPNGEFKTDWVVDDFVYDNIALDWNISISRAAEEAVFWITGPENIIEGETGTYTIHCNRITPAGKPVVINLAYSGTAIDPADYAQVASTTLPGGADTVTFDIVAADNVSVDGARQFTVTIDSIDDTGFQAFEDSRIFSGQSSVTTSIHDEDTVVLTMPDVFVNEEAGTVTIPVTMQVGNGGSPFTVDYSFTDITALGGVNPTFDYNNTGGTLTFNGTAGQVENIVVTLYDTDVVVEGYETFQVNLSNPSIGGIDATRTAIVTIVEGELVTGGTTSIQTDTITLPNPYPVYSLVTVYNYGSPITNRIWIYDFADGTYPGIKPASTELSELEVMPWVTLRRNNIYINANPNDVAYRNSKYTLNLLGIDIDDMIEAIAGNDDDIDSCDLTFSMNPEDQNPVLSKLLYFHWYYIAAPPVALSSNTKNFTANASVGANKSNLSVNFSMGWTDNVYTPDASGNMLGLDASGNGIAEVDTYRHYKSGNNLVMQHQKTANTYDTVVVYDMHCVAGKYVLWMGQDQYEVAISELNDENFSMLISEFMLSRLSMEELLEVYPYILRLDVFAVQEAEIPWYLTDNFLLLVKVVLIIVTIVTLGATSGFLAALELIVVNYLVAELILVVAKFVAVQTGNEELALAIAAVAYAALATGGSFEFSMIDASALTKMVTDFSDLFVELEALEQESVQEDTDRLEEEYEARLDAIEEARDQNKGNDISRLSAYLLSPDSYQVQAIAAQYSFDELFNYDTLVANFHDNQLRIGIV